MAFTNRGAGRVKGGAMGLSDLDGFIRSLLGFAVLLAVVCGLAMALTGAGRIALTIVLGRPVGRRLAPTAGRVAEPCDHCGYDVRGGLLQCPECGASTDAARAERYRNLREMWPTEAIGVRMPDPSEEPVSVLMTDDGWLANRLCQHLEARGVATRVAAPQPIGNSGLLKAFGSHRLLVWTDDEDRARAIIARLLPPSPGAVEQH